VKVTLIQMDVALGKPSVNRAKASDMVSQAAASGTDVILLPEMWNTGYSLKNIRDICDRAGIPSIPMLQAIAKERRVNIVAGSIADSRDGGVYNTSYVINRSGEIVATYSKIHRFGLMDEDKYLDAGDRLCVFALEGHRCGRIICYDLRFPELSRSLALKGIELLFVPAQWPNPRLHHWRSLNIARAIENQMYVVGCNRTGTSGDSSFFGHSMVTDPWGEVVVEAGESEGIIHCDLDLARVNQVRKVIPVFSDRRPAVYQL